MLQMSVKGENIKLIGMEDASIMSGKMTWMIFTIQNSSTGKEKNEKVEAPGRERVEYGETVRMQEWLYCLM